MLCHVWAVRFREILGTGRRSAGHYVTDRDRRGIRRGITHTPAYLGQAREKESHEYLPGRGNGNGEFFKTEAFGGWSPTGREFRTILRLTVLL